MFTSYSLADVLLIGVPSPFSLLQVAVSLADHTEKRSLVIFAVTGFRKGTQPL